MLSVRPASDYHVHLRQGDITPMLVKELKQGGCQRALVMPNLKPPVTSTEQALGYWNTLRRLDDSIEYLVTLYLHPSITPAEIRKAAAAGVVGVKSYPRGVTTNSDSGIESYEVYYEVFKAMEECNMVLNLHGEVPSDADKNICVLNAEEHFLQHLQQLHADFPKLRIVLEHATTKAAVEMVRSLGDTVGCTITVHHLELTVDDWAGKNHNFCKPVAKYPSDRAALRQAVLDRHPRFFLGSDSAPHPRSAKEAACGCAGVFTGPLLLPYMASIFDGLGCLDYLEDFTSGNGDRFYQRPHSAERVTLKKEPFVVPTSYKYGTDGNEVVPFRAGEQLTWRTA